VRGVATLDRLAAAAARRPTACRALAVLRRLFSWRSGELGGSAFAGTAAGDPRVTDAAGAAGSARCASRHGQRQRLQHGPLGHVLGSKEAQRK
jgi:hypothetical protein